VSNQVTAQGTAAAEDLPFRPSKAAGWWPRFRRHRGALIGFGVLLLFGAGALFAPWITQDRNHIDLSVSSQPPSFDHILGTDPGGRDVFARVLYGGRASLSVGLVAACIASAIGTLIGLVSGYAGGKIDNLLMRFTELVSTLPNFFIILILVTITGPSIVNIMMVIGVLGWTGKARLIRGQVLLVRELDYVTASRALGSGAWRLLLKHILPAVVPFVVVGAMLSIAGSIITEAGLSFLGLGVRPPTPTWGNMITRAQDLTVLQDIPWLWLSPGIAIFLTVMAVNFVGDGLRDALDPRSKKD
jgi:peptide/nickel transport system permease protein